MSGAARPLPVALDHPALTKTYPLAERQAPPTAPSTGILLDVNSFRVRLDAHGAKEFFKYDVTALRRPRRRYDGGDEEAKATEPPAQPGITGADREDEPWMLLGG